MEDKSLSEHEQEMVRVRNSAKKIKRNLDEAQASVSRRQGHMDELKALVATQHGLAKTELNKVLKKSQGLAQRLRDYVTAGQTILA